VSTDRGITSYRPEEDDAAEASSSYDQSESEEQAGSTLVRAEYYQFQTMFIGPLPLPDMLEQYERVLPGCAERILAMSERGLLITEEQTHHRQAMESAVVHSDIKRADLGLKFGTVVITLIIIVGAITIFTGHPGYGITLIGGSVSIVLGTYIHGTATRKQELRRKAEQVPRNPPESPDSAKSSALVPDRSNPALSDSN